MTVQEEILSAEAACHFLDISRSTLNRLLSSGELRGLKAGGQWRFRPADLTAYLERKPASISASALPELDVELKWWGEALHEAEVQWALPQNASPDERLDALADGILRLALSRKVSDIHFEPLREGAQIRFRYDGVLTVVRQMPRSLFVPLIRFLKETGTIVRDDGQFVQEGRLIKHHEGKGVEFLLSSLPTLDGETLTLRINDSHASLVLMDEMEFEPSHLEHINRWLESPSGLILTTGPAMSGKVTTLYALLASRISPERKVMSVEEPVEIPIDGVQQISLKRKSGATFASILKSMLNHDPDVLCCGEVQDLETAEMVVQCALNGHLVMSSLLSEGAVEGIEALTDLGVEPFLSSAALLGVISQRLLRRICSNCVIADTPEAAYIERTRVLAAQGGYHVPEDVVWKRGAGCAKCRSSGYRGRIPIFETLGIDETIKTAITRGESAAQLREKAIAGGGMSLFASGVQKAVEGRTTLFEVFRNTVTTSLM